jgi:drug/metabolite transporter (DMT)-like permease
LIFRSVFGGLAILGQILAVQFMPLSVAVSIMMMTVFTTSILAWIVLGDSMTLCEIFTIIMGTFGMFMFSNPTAFSDDKKITSRASKEAKEYPNYALGLGIAVSVTLWMALEFLAMSNLKGFVHSSWKTFSLGLLCTVGCLIYTLIADPGVFLRILKGNTGVTWP